MLYDRRNFGLLRLAGAYQWLPAAPLRALPPLRQLNQEAELLASLGLLAFSRTKEYLMPTPEGYRSWLPLTFHTSRRPSGPMPRARPSGAA